MELADKCNISVQCHESLAAAPHVIRVTPMVLSGNMVLPSVTALDASLTRVYRSFTLYCLIC